MTDDNKKNENEEFEDIRDEGETDQEMASHEEREVEGGEILSSEETLSSEEDNAAVDSAELRREFSEDDAEQPDLPERDYAIGSNMVRNLFIGSGIGAVVLIVVILTLTSAIDQARYTPADTTQYQRTLTSASQELTGYSQGENGRVSIPIEQAISITAERGLNEINSELGVSAPQSGNQNTQPAQNQQAQGAEQGQPQQQGNGQQAQASQDQGGQNQPSGQEGGGGAPEVLTVGESVYTTNCVSCHQANGQGVPGAFPTLANHVPSLYNADRSYLINVLLYGLQGEIQVNEQSYNGVMSAWQQLSDQEIADVLNYASTAWGNNQALQDFEPYTPEQIAAERGKGLSSSDVYNQRPSVSAQQ